MSLTRANGVRTAESPKHDLENAKLAFASFLTTIANTPSGYPAHLWVQEDGDGRMGGREGVKGVMESTVKRYTGTR